MRVYLSWVLVTLSALFVASVVYDYVHIRHYMRTGRQEAEDLWQEFCLLKEKHMMYEACTNAHSRMRANLEMEVLATVLQRALAKIPVLNWALTADRATQALTLIYINSALMTWSFVLLFVGAIALGVCWMKRQAVSRKPEPYYRDHYWIEDGQQGHSVSLIK